MEGREGILIRGGDIDQGEGALMGKEVLIGEETLTGWRAGGCRERERSHCRLGAGRGRRKANLPGIMQAEAEMLTGPETRGL